MNKEEFYWDLHNYKVYAKIILPDTEPKALIAVVHGMGEHSNRYYNLEGYFIEKKYAFISFDQIGHGKTISKRGHVPNYEWLLDNIKKMIDVGREKFPNIPLILFGHSMGGNLVLNYLLTKNTTPISCAVVSAPWLKLATSPALLKIKLAKLIHNFIPALVQNTRLEKNAISRDSEYNLDYYSDPLVHNSITLRFFTSVHEKGLWSIDHAHLLKTPLLLYHGDADKITSHIASKEFFEHCPHKNLITYKVFKDTFHEAHNDINKQEVFKLIESYIENQIGLNLIA